MIQPGGAGCAGGTVMSAALTEEASAPTSSIKSE
jgi:hypothetical protein